MGDIIQKLKSEVEGLKETRVSVEHRVNEARRNEEEIEPGVQNWLTKVEAIIAKSELILNNEAQQVRFCLNLVQRHQLSRKAVKMANEVLEMKKEGKFDRVSYPVALPQLVESSLTKTSDFLDFESRRSTVEQIMDALVDNNVNKIGIFGMGGVGKTMTIKEVVRRVMEKKLFDEVVVTVINQTPDLKRIQGELAEKLGLTLEEDTIEGRALKLHKRLTTEKRCLVVLDDIWNFIDLEMIGIPSEVDHKGCKVLLISRDKHTLYNDMCINNIFEIEVLRREEAWDLFKTIVGEMIESFDLKSIVVQIVEECENLPIAIITVAKALRNKSIHVWKDALYQLKHSMDVNIVKGMSEEVYASLKFCYDHLECEEAKMLFLLCSMFPTINVQHLHIYAMGLDLLRGVDTVGKGRDRIKTLVDVLISHSLLLEYKNDYVKMHDLVRDVAIFIASTNDQIRTLSYVKDSNEWEAYKVSGDHTAVYLNVKGCQSILQKLMLPKIQLLILVGRWTFVQELPINFFEEMKELKVLELQWMKISLLRPSLHSFKNVRSLNLFCCELGNIDMIGELNKLEILSLRGSNITKIPMAISQLIQLKVLDLSSCYKLEIIPPNILLKLTKLEELNLETYNGWEGEELNKERKNASLSELNNLACLSALCLCIPDEKVMPKQMFSLGLNLETFNISIGFPPNIIYRNEIIRKRMYLKMKSECCMNDGMKMLLKRTEQLHLEGSFGAKIFLYGLDHENDSSHVKYLDLHNIYGLQYVVHEQKQPFRKALSNVVHLHLKNLKNLVSIIHGYNRRSPFNKLKFVEVNGCKKLRSLFFKSIVEDLSNLEKIEIEDCEMMEVIVVMANEEATNKFEFTHLKILQLRCLPQLTSFSSKIENFEQLNLENSEKGGTSKFSNNNSLFSEEVSFPNLEQLEIESADNLKMICDNALFPNSFSKLAEVYIDSCNNLEKVFSSRIMSILACLEIISIKNCHLLEGIFEARESNVTKQSVFLLPQLKKLKLSNLPNLRYVWSEDPCEFLVFENVEILSIHQCPKLKKEYVAEVLPQLKCLKIELKWNEIDS